jgi:hypothetical protein
MMDGRMIGDSENHFALHDAAKSKPPAGWAPSNTLFKALRLHDSRFCYSQTFIPGFTPEMSN